MKAYFIKHFPLHAGHFAEYADIFAMCLCLAVTSKFNEIKYSMNKKKKFFLFLVLLIIGIKESAVLNNIFTAVNLTVTVIVVIVGLTKIQGHNWNISPDEVCLLRNSKLSLCI